MRSRSALWERITKRGRFDLETKAVIGGKEYTAISAPVIDRALMSSPLSVGNCTAATLALSILTDDEIASKSPILIQGRVTDGTNISEWKDFGTFFINQRDTSYEGLVTVSCYDAMLKANQNYVDGSSSPANWPKPMTEVVAEVAYRIGVTLDPRTVINTGEEYMVPYPSGLTMRQVLGYIGACHGGNWIITEENKLRLVPLVTSPDETFFVIDPDYERIQTDDGYTLIHDIQTVFNAVLPMESPGLINVPVVLGQITTGTPVTVTGVTAEGNDNNSYTAGDDTGAVIALGQNPYASQAICDALLETFAGLVYSPYTSSNSVYDPATELGDQVKIGDRVFSVIMAETLTLDLGFRANISAPNSEELSDEYPYLSEVQMLRQTAVELNAAIEAAAEKLTETAESVSGDVDSMQKVLTAEITRASGVEAELAKRIEDEEKRAKKAEEANAGNITALGGRVTSLEGTATAHDSRLETLEKNASSASGDVSGLATRLSAAEQTIKDIQKKDEAQDTSISTVQSLVSGHATRLLALENVTGQHTTDIDDLKGRVKTLEENTPGEIPDVSGLETRIGAAEGNITALQGSVSSQGETLTGLQGTVTEQGAALSELQSDIGGLKTAVSVLETTVPGLSEQLTAILASIASIEERLAALENQG